MLVLVDREGHEKALTEQQGLYMTPRFSPDGRRLAVVNRSEPGHTDIWVYDLERATPTRLTFEESNIAPIWTPDGTRITFSSFRSGSFDLYSQPSDGSGEPELLLTRPYGQFPTSWSPDIELLTLIEANPETGFDILMLSSGSAAESKPSPFRAGPFNESHAVVEIGREPTFSPGTPRRLFDARWVSTDWSSRGYDISPDGSHFVAVKSNRQALTKLNLVLNWSEELKRLVPGN
jgi:Tol biopolymer transport system component